MTVDRTAQSLRRATVTCLLASAAAVVVSVSMVPTAHAQGWWPWADKQEPVRPREPVYRGPPPAPIPGQPGAGQFSNPPIAARPQGPAGNICLQLEQRLVSEGQRGASTRDSLPKLESELRTTERALAQAQSQLERGDCYEYFLFTKSLRNSPTCRTAAGSVESLRRRLSELDGQRGQAAGTSDRRVQDDLVRELARNGCGNQYVTEARRLDQRGGFWTTEEDNSQPRAGNQFGSLPFATYRTICVRLCDGYFFPVSFSTLPNHFQRDVDTCQSQCAAPVELYYHQNPGAGVDKAVSVKSQSNYTSLKSAFRYRKEFVHGCSCKEAEYQVGAGERRADAGPTGVLDRQYDGASKTTASVKKRRHALFASGPSNRFTE
jgi:Protein of unknown function (DUF2865)